MAAPVGSLVVRVGSDIRGLTSGLQKGARQVEDFGRSANKVARDFRKLQKELAESRNKVSSTTAAYLKFARVVGPFIGVAFGVRAVGSIVRTADAYTQLQNRLRAVTGSSEELERVQSRLFEISRDTRSSVESNVELFSRLRLATKDLGTSEQEILQFTESLNQAIKLSGASATEAQAGILQLAQGMASGTLRGDELRSVLEQLPAVADVIAKSLGVTRGQLREMGTQGEITADVILRAFREARGELSDQFGKTVPTVDESLVQLQNSLLKLGGAFSQATGLGENLAEAISNIAGSVDRFANSASIRFLRDLPDILGAALDVFTGTPSKPPEIPKPEPELALDPSDFDLPDFKLDQATLDLLAQPDVGFRAFFETASEGFANLKKESTETFAAMSQSAITFLQAAPAQLESLLDVGPSEETRKQLEDRLEVIRQGLLSENELRREIEEQAFAERTAALREGLEMELLTEEEFRRRSEALEKQHQDNLTAIAKAAQQERIKNVTTSLDAIASITSSLGRTLFENNKAVAIATAVIDGISGAIKTWNAYPYPWNILPTAAHVAGTAAQIAQIQSSSFSGGRTTSPGAVAAPTSPAQTGAPGSSGGGAGIGGGQTVNISLAGQTFPREQVVGLIEKINEAVADGARIRVV